VTVDTEWEVSQVVAGLTTYIAGIEDTLKEPMTRAVAYLIICVDAPFDTLAPIVQRAIESVEVELPWELPDGTG
jgi:hypothetical protein